MRYHRLSLVITNYHLFAVFFRTNNAPRQYGILLDGHGRIGSNQQIFPFEVDLEPPVTHLGFPSEFTPEGAEERDNLLPSSPVENSVTHTYDPVQGCILKENLQKLASEKPVLSISECPFEWVFPKEIIRQEIQNGKYPWFYPNSRISRIGISWGKH